MGKILVVKNADFSNVAVEQVGLDNLTWTEYIPFSVYERDDYPNNAVSSNYSFNLESHIFSGALNYKKVKISMKAKTTINDIRVCLVEVPDYDSTSESMSITFVCDLGTINLLSDVYVHKKFNLPGLEQNKKYTVAVLSKPELYYLTACDIIAESSDRVLTIKYDVFNDSWNVEQKGDTGQRGSWGYSYYQMKFGY